MFREMRRKKQLLSEAETVAMLQACTSGVLAVQGDNGYPYAVPLSYAYEDGNLYFHFANAGHKLDSILKNDKVSFCVIQKDEVIQATFTTHFRSAIVFGRARILTDASEKRHALECLVAKYSPDYTAQGQTEIERSWDRVSLAEVRIEKMSGKAASELIQA